MDKGDEMRNPWLTLAQLAWFGLFALTIVVFIAALPVYRDRLYTICTDPDICMNEQLTPVKQTALQAAGISWPAYVNFRMAWIIGGMILWSGLGLFIAIRRPENPAALLVAMMLVLFYATNPSSVLASAGTSWSQAASIVNYLTFISIIIVWYVFPNGRFVPRWTIVPFFLFPALLIAGILDRVPEGAGTIILVGLVGSMIGAQIYRYLKISGLEERRQTRWVVYGLMITFVGTFVLSSFETSATLTGGSLALLRDGLLDVFTLLLPLTLAISVLRYRLYNIDVIIRKTLIYTTLTVLLALVYFGGVVILQEILAPLTGQGNSPLVIVLTTLGVAALFTPLRRRVQEAIDRRFFRRKYQAEQVLADFARTARDEPNLEALTGELERVVRETMQPERIDLWIRPIDGTSHSGKGLAIQKAPDVGGTRPAI